MALIPAVITVNFNAVYAGPHRICWRIGNVGPYDCSTIVNCIGGGAACSGNINIQVDYETCDQVTFEGYVQAACEDLASPNGRIAFSETFTPDPTCKRYLFTCLNAGVESVTITNPGSGYGAAPAVAFAGDGAGAAATAVVGTGFILSLALTLGGSGYTNGVYVAVPLIGGTGAGATANITIVGGVVTIATINAPGNGYTTGDVLAPDTGVVGVPGVSAQLTATSDLGTITAINVTVPGSGYTTPPTVTVDPPGAGVTATGTAVLLPCPDFTLPDCDGVGITGPEIEVGDSLATCSSTGTPANPFPAQLDIALNGNCLCTCQNITVTNTALGGGLRVWYTLCGGGVTSVDLDAGQDITFCMVQDSVYLEPLNPGVTGSIVINGTCQAA